MVGIDIVDHSDRLLRKRDDRAFRLITHPEDSHSIRQDIHQESLFWLFWAAKEATYKCHRATIRFDPKTIPINLFEKENNLYFSSMSVNGRLEQNKDYTLATCSINGLESTFSEIYQQVTKDESATIRKLMINSLLSKYGLQATISSDSNGLPIAVFNSKTHLATFTHHHTYLGFICEA